MVYDADLREELAEAIAGASYVRIHRDLPDNEVIGCYVEAMGDALLLVQPFVDFFADGWAVIRLADIVEVEEDEREWTIGSMLHTEGILRQTHPFPLELGSFAALLRQLHAKRCPVIVETEGPDPDEKLSLFTLGPIEAVDDLRVHVRPIDAFAHYEEVVQSIPLRDITKVQIASPYLKNFAKYADWPKKDGAK